MRKLFYKAIIEDIHNENCTHAEQEALLDTFEYTMKKMATTLARKSWYALEDYADSKQLNIEHFTLTLEYKKILDHEQWHGIFEHGNKILTVIGTLEE